MTNYDVLTWNKMPLYQCRLCSYDTLDETEMSKHQVDAHTPAPEQVEVKVQLLDRFGNVVEGETVDVTVEQPAEVRRGVKKPKGDADGENHAD